MFNVKECVHDCLLNWQDRLAKILHGPYRISLIFIIQHTSNTQCSNGMIEQVMSKLLVVKDVLCHPHMRVKPMTPSYKRLLHEFLYIPPFWCKDWMINVPGVCWLLFRLHACKAFQFQFVFSKLLAIFLLLAMTFVLFCALPSSSY